MMNRRLLALSTVTTALGLALALQAPAARAEGMANPSQGHHGPHGQGQA